MHRTSRDFFAEERNLNLMTSAPLAVVASANRDFMHKVSSVSLAGWPSNLLLNMRRIGAQTAQ